MPSAYAAAVLAQQRDWVALFPEQASDTAARTDALFFVLLALTGLVALGVAGLIVLFAVRYREGSPARRPADPPVDLRLEVAWTAIPLLIVLALFGWSAVLYVGLYDSPPAALKVDVVGKQWMWKVQHANGRREVNELHLPTGRAVELLVSSQDVIHSFYVPAFRIKRDALPERITSVTFVPTRPGVYRLFCAEYCGTEHSDMIGRVVVLEPAEFERWLAAEPPREQSPPPGSPGAPGAPLALRGQGAFFRLGCNGCHLPTSAVRAPRLDGIWGREVRLQDDRVVVADEAYLRQAILHPNAQLTAGYPAPSLMPSYAGQLAEGELEELIAFIRQLRDGWPEEVR